MNATHYSIIASIADLIIASCLISMDCTSLRTTQTIFSYIIHFKRYCMHKKLSFNLNWIFYLNSIFLFILIRVIWVIRISEYNQIDYF